MRVQPNAASQTEWQEKRLEYLRYEYYLVSHDLVIDIGAYRGEWAEKIFDLYHPMIILIEPTPYILGTPFGQVINKAAATYDGTKKFGGAYYYTSAHEEPDHEYPCFDINTLLERYSEIALVKFNCEGDEYDLLDHIIGANLHSRIANLQIQFHEIDGEPYLERYERIASRLRESHEIQWRYPFCWESWRRA